MISEEGLEAIVGLTIAASGLIGMAASGWSMYTHKDIPPTSQVHQIQVDTQEAPQNDYNWGLAWGVFTVSTLAVMGGMTYANSSSGEG